MNKQSDILATRDSPIKKCLSMCFNVKAEFDVEADAKPLAYFCSIKCQVCKNTECILEGRQAN